MGVLRVNQAGGARPIKSWASWQWGLKKIAEDYWKREEMGSGWPNCDLLLVINLAKRPAGPRINLTQEITVTVSQSWF